MSIFIILILVIIISTFIKAVPANTVLIIDRNSHYLKTKKSGLFFINPATDKITTRISKYKISKIYSENFETHDGKIFKIVFTAEYHANDLEDVLSALASARRSVDDVLNSSVYWAVNNLSASDFSNTPSVLLSEINPKLTSEANELKISIDRFNINSITPIPSNINVIPFKPHLNSHSVGPIRFN